MEPGKEPCKCPHHKFVPALVVLFGLTFLLGALNVISQEIVSITWPILVMLGGLLKIGASKCKCCDHP